MAIFSREEFRQLAEVQNDICVSIFVPTFRYGQEVRAGIPEKEFKNQLKEVRHKLQDASFKPREIDQILQPAEDLLNDKTFWTYQSDGLAMFMTNEFASYYSVPINFEPFNYLNDHFYLKSMVPLLNENGRFYILALSMNKVRFFEALRYSISEISLEDIVPTNMYDGLRYDNPEAQVQSHSGTGAEGTGTMFHGQGGKNQEKPENIKRYFSRIDNALRETLLNGEKAPLVLAGVEYLIPIYKDANGYNHLVDDYVRGNHDNTEIVELHERAWECVKHLFDKDHQAAKERANDLIGMNKGDSDIENVVRNAYFGLVDELFVANMQNVWGTYDVNNDKVVVHNEREENDYCLLNFAAIHTILKGGRVYLVDKNDMPSLDTEIAATFRVETIS